MKLDTDHDWVKLVNQNTRKSEYYQTLTQSKYRHIKGYIEYDQVMFEIARTRYAYDFYDPQYFTEDFIHRNSLISLNDFLVNGFRSFWLSRNLFDAFLHTDIPQRLESFHRVIQNAVLFLPEGLYTPDGSSVRWLIISHRLATDVLPDVQLKTAKVHTVKNDMDCLSITFYDAQRYQYSTNRPLYLVDGKLVEEYENDNFILRTHEETDERVEKEFMDSVFTLVVNTLLFLQTYEEKEVVEHVRRNDVVKKRTKSTPKLEPYLIGENYTTKRETTTRSVIGTNTTKKTQHWRRGHYRNQVVGKRDNPTHKLVWIEPVLVNAVD